MKTKLLLLIICISVVSYAQFPTNGLVGYYDFTSGSLLDQANGNNFTKTGTASINVNDRFVTASNAIDLNEDYLTRPDIAISGTHTFTVSYSFWINTTTDNSNLETIIDDSTRNTVTHFDSDDYGYYIYLQDGKIKLTSRFGTRLMWGNPIIDQGYGQSSTKFVADGNWHHIVVEFKTYITSGIQYVTSKIYVDAISESNSATHNGIVNSPNTTGNVTIANSRTNHLTSTNQYKDIIDDIFVYNRSLTPAEVTQIATINGYCLTPQSSIISSNTISNNSADINISESGTFDIAYHKTGESFASATIISGVSSGVQNISGLDEFTSYEVYVRKQCVPNTTGWSDSHNFSTTRTIGRIYVDIDALGNNNGVSWVNAYTDLNDALANMQANEEIWVADGTYTPDTSNRDLSFNITMQGAKLYGGFVGTESNLSERDFRNNSTILSGDLSANDDTTIEFSNTTRNDNSYNIITINANNAIIDGFTISGAHANGSSSVQQSGGGIFKGYTVSNLDVYNCKFENNVAIGTAAALFSRYDIAGTLKVHSCTFANNLARHGTTVYFYTSNGYTINAEVINSLFYRNTAKNNGGTAGYAGSAGWFRAIGSGSTLNCTLLNNTYYGNQDLGTATGLNNFNRGTVGMSYTSGTLNADVTNCIFWGNTTTNGVTTRSIAQIHTNLGQNILVDNSIDQNNFASITPANVSNSISSDPLFTDDANNDFTLQSSSPAIDAGNGNKVPAGIITDLAGNPRFYNGSIDMGPYEESCISTCYTLTLNIIGNGTVDNSGINVSSVSSFPANASLSLTPNALTGNQFLEWSGDATGNANPLAITMDSDKTINATFIELPLFVDKDATGNNDGSSWANAYADLSTALSNVGTYKSIWIADGVYTPTVGSRSNTFNFSTDDLKIYGGFNGTETDLSQRDIAINKSILSGDLNGDDTDVDYATSTRAENSYHVVTLSANGIELDGLTIQDGHANSTTNNELGRGSAIYKNFSANALFLNNCIIKNNVGGKTGGAIFARYDVNGSISINNTIFDNNLSVYASGLYSYTNGNETLDVTITNSLFSNNTSKNNGSFLSYTGSSAWIRAYGSGSVVTTNIVNTTFANNIDIGTQAGVHERGTLSLSRNLGTHNVTLSNMISYNNTGTGAVTTLAVSRGHESSANQTLVYNSIDENGFSNISAGNLTNTSAADPLFADAGNGDYTLQSGSPAIDTGDNSKIPSGVNTDLTGNIRIENTVVDMGCYEYKPVTIVVTPKVYLQGAFTNPNVGETTLMRDDLRVGGLIPATSTYADGLTCNASVFTPTGADAIVDWVWVELRDAGDNTSVVASQSALLQRDGDVVSHDGVSPLVFTQSSGNYFVVVNHRSHLGVMSIAAVALTGTNTNVDLSAASASVLGTTNAVVNMGGTFALVAGDFSGDGQVLNTDVQSVISLAGTSGYSPADADMNGQILNTDIQNIISPNAGKGQQF